MIRLPCQHTSVRSIPYKTFSYQRVVTGSVKSSCNEYSYSSEAYGLFANARRGGASTVFGGYEIEDKDLNRLTCVLKIDPSHIHFSIEVFQCCACKMILTNVEQDHIQHMHNLIMTTLNKISDENRALRELIELLRPNMSVCIKEE